MSENTDLQTENGELARVNPPVDIFENDEGYIIRADVPGVAQDAIDIQFERGQLSIEARRPHDETGTRLRAEFGPVTFQRSFRIPERIDADHISAKLAHGVLELQLPKAAEIRPHKITIQA